MLKDLVLKNRSYRRYHEDVRVPLETLRDLVGLARLSPCAANLQPLRYILSVDPEKNSLIFECLKWAGYLKDWPGPQEGERPPAYIIVLKDLDVSKAAGCDHGIAAQTILLGAVERGLGGCIIASVNRPVLAQHLSIPGKYEVLLVIAVGKPKETVVIEPVSPDGDIRYWRDKDNVHHVPKLRLDDIIISPITLG